MYTFLFKYLVFGPIDSRRLGKSLGINILPKAHKFCNFDCVYCECGEDLETHSKVEFPSVEEIIEELLLKTQMLKDRNIEIDTISFAGNGEPTMHPEFEEIMHAVVNMRDLFFPNSKIAVLNNASMLNKNSVKRALKMADYSICKLDAGDDALFKSVNRPKGNLTFDKIEKNLMSYEGPMILQSLFFKGIKQNQSLGNFSSNHIQNYLDEVEKIKPESVMLYSLDRKTALPDLEAVSIKELKGIALQLNEIGITSSVA